VYCSGSLGEWQYCEIENNTEGSYFVIDRYDIYDVLCIGPYRTGIVLEVVAPAGEILKSVEQCGSYRLMGDAIMKIREDSNIIEIVSSYPLTTLSLCISTESSIRQILLISTYCDNSDRAGQ